MNLTAHQPAYIPWLGLLSKIAHADLFCVFDGVPMEGSGFENRQRIKTATGVQWLTVPVMRSRDIPVKDVLIAAGQPWQRKHWRTIELAYHKAPHYDRYAPAFKEVLMRPWSKLVDLDSALLAFFCEAFDIKTPIVWASAYPLNGHKSGLVLDMCKKLGATEYVFGSQGKGYADVKAFEEAWIKVEFQEYQHPTYPQLHGSFQPFMGAIDLLFNVGGKAGREVIG